MKAREARVAMMSLVERSKKQFEEAQALFVKEAAVNPTQAILSRAAELTKLQAKYTVANELGYYAMNVTEDFKFLDDLRRQHKRYLDDMLTHHCWRANSTCPWTNVANQEEGKAIGEIVIFLNSILDEIDG